MLELNPKVRKHVDWSEIVSDCNGTVATVVTNSKYELY